MRAAKGKSVLFVEDDPMVRHAVARLLRAEGLTVIEARNAHVAFRYLRDLHCHIDVLFVDVVMPHMGGLDLALLAREIRPDLPVIFTSGHVDDPSVRRTVAEHPEFISKPISRSQLREVFGRVLDLRAA